MFEHEERPFWLEGQRIAHLEMPCDLAAILGEAMDRHKPAEAGILGRLSGRGAGKNQAILSQRSKDTRDALLLGDSRVIESEPCNLPRGRDAKVSEDLQDG